jgi:hypothetical protein
MADDFRAIDARLRAILEPYIGEAKVVEGTSMGWTLLGKPHPRYPDGAPFAGVRTGKSYVSFHLMPVYGDPRLLEGISPELRRRMQGKSCFNFTRLDEERFRELEALTAAGAEGFRKAGLL